MEQTDNAFFGKIPRRATFKIIRSWGDNLSIKIYLGLTLMVAGLVALIFKKVGAVAFEENGLIECVQFGLIAAAVSTVLFSAVYTENMKTLSYALVILFSLASIRELDSVLDKLIPGMGWQLPAACVGVYGLCFWWLNHRRLESEMRAFWGSRSFGILLLAVIVIVPISQFLGWKAFLKPLLDNNYSRDLKRLIEESGELVGYLLTLLGSVEFALEHQYRRLPLNEQETVQQRKAGTNREKCLETVEQYQG